MSNKPILILQMQRMGDLVLTFPLMLWLQHQYPNHPIWVVAERTFFEGLMPLSPHVTYFPREAAPLLAKEAYALVINLSHRPEAAQLAGKVTCDHLIGPATTASGTHYIHGKWQLYRASLVQNNRHNLYHWADLNGLDALPLALIGSSRWPAPETERSDAARIGVFLGASDAAKRPTVDTWSTLVTALLKRGMKPVLLGGKADMPLGHAVALKTGTPALNLCGRFTLAEFTALTRTLRCMITPDTGPMHVAAWTGTPTLNLSMGYVHPWETGPYQPGHHVLRSNISCNGCWQCKHSSFLCHNAFSMERVAALTHAITKKGSSAVGVTPAGQRLYATSRDTDGLYSLQYADGTETTTPRHRLALFWKSYFGGEFGLWDASRTVTAWQDLCAISPSLMPILKKELLTISKDLLGAIKGKPSLTTSENYWKKHPPFIRPLTGYMHLALQNQEFSPAGLADALSMLERLLALSSR
ncbi:glycosyltransferase family 9 protein [Desulfovibrio mangrovi]|uniref:glycosyltransferase family 9 protein n=1 Tax=Desulfovibrio mangrovi TaxID=2976983 RepID=UPI0022473F3B|nr:glycosyltransferase family 9 protein [Desulfovibrio mangrovi]UZP68182.1 glycosyltransferase family 9 protein [Desulfovibrio mangrovi]